MTPAPLAAALEVALNRYLRLEPEAEAALASLAGKRIAVQLTPLGWHLLLEMLPGGSVRVGVDEPDPPADVTLTGSPVELLARGAEMARGEPFSAKGLQVRGDAETLRRFAAALNLVGADVEEWLAPWLGDVLAHRAAGFMRSALQWGRQTFSTLALNTTEFLQEESGDLPRRVDVEAWQDEVDLLRDAVDRFEARLQRLERSLLP
ncbi:MAG: SCP2 sterol-binding domain-containing protein [Polycyclovorans sp.]|nr:SCP2 sterol-binding domain-containing protein [Polycyclovorans sp.]